MALMERITTLLRANLHELLERAEDPETMLKQLLRDMENQLLQLKTQVAMALAEGHLLEKRVREAEAALADWQRKAELAVGKGEDGLARGALARALTEERLLTDLRAQAAKQAAESEALRGTYSRLQAKAAETQAGCEALLAQHRRAQRTAQAQQVQSGAEAAVAALGVRPLGAVGRLRARVDELEASNQAMEALADGHGPAAPMEDRLNALESDQRIEELLLELKTKQQRMLAAG